MYPLLPATIEMTEEDKTLKWVNDTSKMTTHGKKTNTADTVPVYESENPQTNRSQGNKSEESGRRPKQDTYRLLYSR